MIWMLKMKFHYLIIKKKSKIEFCPICGGRFILPEDANLSMIPIPVKNNCNCDGTSNGDCCNSGTCSSSSSNGSLFKYSKYKQVACYRCRDLVDDCNDELLPPYIGDNTSTIVKTMNLRNQIKDFLLDDE